MISDKKPRAGSLRAVLLERLPVPLFLSLIRLKLRLFIRWIARQAWDNRRRLLLGAVPWIILLAVPATRAYFFDEAIGEGWLPYHLNISHAPREREDFQALAARAPKDALTQFAISSTWTGTNAAYDEFLRRHPDQLWLLAHRAMYAPKIEFHNDRYVNNKYRDDRVAGEFEQPELDQQLSDSSTTRRRQGSTSDEGPAINLLDRYKPPVAVLKANNTRPAKAPAQPPLSTSVPKSLAVVRPVAGNEIAQFEKDDFSEEIEEPRPGPDPARPEPYSTVTVPARVIPGTVLTELALARRGAALDRANAFWDFCEAASLFGLRQDAQALEAFSRAAGKQRFERYGKEWVYVNSFSRRLGGRVSALERRVVDNPQQGWPAYVRHIVQLVLWQGVLAERARDHAKALDLYADAMHFARLYRREAFSSQEVLMGCALEAITWEGLNRQVTDEEVALRSAPVDGGDWLKLGSQKFAAYAASHGRTDLASEALAQGVESARDRVFIQAASKKWVNTGHVYLTRRESKILFLAGAMWPLVLLHVLLLSIWRSVVFCSNLPPARFALSTRIRGVAVCMVPATAVLLIGLLMSEQLFRDSWNATSDEAGVILVVALTLPIVLAVAIPTGRYVLRKFSWSWLLPSAMTGVRFAHITVLGGLLMFAAATLIVALVASQDLQGRVWLLGLEVTDYKILSGTLIEPGALFYCAFLGMAFLYWMIIMRWKGTGSEARLRVLAWHRQILADWALCVAFILLCTGTLLAPLGAKANRLVDEREARGSHWWLRQPGAVSP